MSDRDHPDHISRLSDDELERLHSTLSIMVETDKLNKSTGWQPDLSPVDRAIDRVYQEMLERELLRDNG